MTLWERSVLELFYVLCGLVGGLIATGWVVLSAIRTVLDVIERRKRKRNA